MKVTLFACVGTEFATGRAGLVTILMGGYPIPLICYEETNVDKLKELAFNSANHTGVRVVRLDEAETLGTVETLLDRKLRPTN